LINGGSSDAYESAALLALRGGVKCGYLGEREVDLTLKTIVEFREEMREFRLETRRTLSEHSHRLNVIEATIAGLKADVGILLSACR
jgi:hypothetical protein